MRYRDIIAEEPGDTWEQRNAATKRREGKRVKAVAKVKTATAAAAHQSRAAADRRSAANDKITAARRDLANTPTAP